MSVTSAPSITLQRREVVARLVAKRDPNLIFVAGIGSPCWDLVAAGDNPLNFYVNGVMGSACAVALGLALAQPKRRVIVVTGDGELLMALGVLATIGVCAPKNLAIVVLDNERYLETGNQPTHTAHGVDLAAVARACTIERATTVFTQDELEAAIPQIRNTDGPSLTVVKITAEKPPLVLPPLDAAYQKNRLRENLLGRP